MLFIDNVVVVDFVVFGLVIVHSYFVALDNILQEAVPVSMDEYSFIGLCYVAITYFVIVSKNMSSDIVVLFNVAFKDYVFISMDDDSVFGVCDIVPCQIVFVSIYVDSN